MFAKQLQIDLAVAIVNHAFVFQEVAGESGARDQIGRSRMQGHVIDPGDPLLDQRHAILVAEK